MSEVKRSILPPLADLNFPDEPDKQHMSLDRIDLRDQMNKLYDSIPDSTVAVLDGRWGVGKTTFARRWLEQLDKDKFNAIYFDAFSKDYLDSPFNALAATLLAKVREKSPKKFEKLLSKAAAVSRKLAITSLKIGARVITLNALTEADLKALTSSEDSVSDEVEELVEEAAKEILRDQSKSDNAFAAFRLALQEFNDSESGDDGAAEKKTIFVVDELDRCQPDFALGIIEALKHFFRTEGYHFILITNMDHMQEVVSSKYGIKNTAAEYLQKFYDFTIKFEKHERYRHEHRSGAYSNRVLGSLLRNDLEQRNKNEVIDLFSKFSIAYNLSLRTIEHVATSFALSYNSVFDQRLYSPYILLIPLAFMKVLRPELYEQARTRSVQFDCVLSFLDTAHWEEADRVREVVGDYFRYYLDESINVNDEKWSYYSDFIRYGFGNREDVIPFLTNNVLDVFAR